MAPVPIIAVISVTSEDHKHPADNILKNKKWLTSSSDNHQETCEIILQLQMPSIINFIDVGYINTSSIEISVGCSWWASSSLYDAILQPVTLQTQVEGRTGKNKVGCKMFNCPEHLNSEVCKGKWDKIKITMKQIYSKNKQMGLEFVRISNSLIQKSRKQGNPSLSSTDNAEEILESSLNHWKNSPLSRLCLQTEKGKAPEIDTLKDRLLRISGTTEDGSSNKNTLRRTAKMVLSSRAVSSQSTFHKSNMKSSKTTSNRLVENTDSEEDSAAMGQSMPYCTSSIRLSNQKNIIKSKVIVSQAPSSLAKSALSNGHELVDVGNPAFGDTTRQSTSHKSSIKSQKGNGSHKQDVKSTTIGVRKNATPLKKQCKKLQTRKSRTALSSSLTEPEYGCGGPVVSPRTMSLRQTKSPMAKDAAVQDHSLLRTDAFSKYSGKLNPNVYGDSNNDFSKSQYVKVDQKISPAKTPHGQDHTPKSTTKTPKAKRNLNLHGTPSPNSGSIEDLTRIRRHDIMDCQVENSFSQVPTTSSKLDIKPIRTSLQDETSSTKNEHLQYSSTTDLVCKKSDVSIETHDFSKSEIKRIKKQVEVFFNSLDMEEMDPDKVALKELRASFEMMNDIKLDKSGREYFRNVTANFLELVISVKQHKSNRNRANREMERKRTNESELPTTSKSRKISSESDDCEIVQTMKGVQCPLCMNYFPEDVIVAHAALCGEDTQQTGSHDVEIISSSHSQQQDRRENFIDLSDNMGLTEAEKQRWLNFSRKPKPYHPRMDKSLFQGHQLIKCPTCGQHYKSNEIEEHSDECAEKVNSGFVKRGLYLVRDGS